MTKDREPTKAMVEAVADAIKEAAEDCGVLVSILTAKRGATAAIRAMVTASGSLEADSSSPPVDHGRVEALTEALTPSVDTKAAYIGEFRFPMELYHPRLGSETRWVDVPWTTIKEIMAAIRDRATLTNKDTADGR